MYQEPMRQRRLPGPVAMSPMHTDPRSHQREREFDWDQDDDDFDQRRQVKSPSLSDASPAREQRRTNGGRNSHSHSPPQGKREVVDPYGGKKGMKSFQIKTRKKESKMLKDDGKRSMFQDQSSSENSSRSRSRSGSPKRRSTRFEKDNESPSNRLSCLAKIKSANLESTSPAMVS
jgi:hypothetical protein